MLTPDFKEFAALPNLNRIKYLVVGGYALAADGHSRYTGDLDFWIGTESENADRDLAALEALGFGRLGIKKGDLVAPNQVIQMGYPPARIDLLTSIDGVSFTECYARRMILEKAVGCSRVCPARRVQQGGTTTRLGGSGGAQSDA